MTLKRRRIFLFTLLGAASLFFLLEGNLLKNPRTLLESEDSFVILARAVNIIKSEYIEEPAPRRTMEGAFKGLINSLDICSGYLDKNNTEKYKRLYGKSAYETGLILYKTRDSFPVIIGIKENSPAKKHGLELGETIGAINGNSTLEMSMTELNLAQKSDKPGPLLIKVLKRNKDEEVNIKRETIYKSFYTFEPDRGPGGLIQIHAFFSPLTEEIKKKVVSQISNEKNPLIIDLRYCHEGTLQEAREFINLFMQKKNIGYIKTKENKKEPVQCLNQALIPKIPLIIWTNQSTIGASESVASILKKYKDAKIIGSKTPGLMSVKTLITLKDQSSIVLTTGIFHPYSKADSWHQGINPDIALKEKDSNSYLKATLNSLSEI